MYCIFTTATVDLIFYQYSLPISMPSLLFAGSFTVVAPEGCRKIMKKADLADTV
jgi:hypothetical protein